MSKAPSQQNDDQPPPLPSTQPVRLTSSEIRRLEETLFSERRTSSKRSSEPAQYYYPSFSQNAAAHFLKSAAESGVLGAGKAEAAMHLPVLRTLLKTIPYTLIVAQAVWSAVVTLTIFFFADKTKSAFSANFWTSRVNLPASVAYGMGWALFVLLGFYVREASQRYTNALAIWTRMTERLLETVRHVVQVYPSTTWHPGDTDRIIAHLIAYPIALKMMLRGERERAQLAPFLHPDDVEDILSSDSMHVHCLRVVRAYLSSAEDDAPYGFTPLATSTPAGWGTRFFVIELVDSIDQHANAAIRIANFQPSIGYVNHLNIFYFIWMSFLPLALVKSSGWFTVLWSVLISYGVGMMLVIADALNEPFGYDIQDIRLNRLAASAALRILNKYFNPKLTLDAVIDSQHSTPFWLEFPAPTRQTRMSFSDIGETATWSALRIRMIFQRLWRAFLDLGKVLKELSVRLKNPSVSWPLCTFLLWILFITFLTWSIAPNEFGKLPEDVLEKCRWWCLYLPIDTSTTNYVSLGLFLLLGFWMSDAYERYWSALMLWQTTIRSGIDEVVFQFSVICKPGLWHHRDRERLFSYLAALPYVCKMSLRGSDDTSELEGILSVEDIAAVDASASMRHHVFDVIYGYCNSVDSQDGRTLQSGENPLGITAYSTMFNLWGVEKALQECETMKNFPISKSFTSHLGVFTALWLALLPISTIRYDGFLTIVYLVPIGYSIINLIVVGKELSDPFGYDKHDLPLDMFCEEMRDSIHNIYQSTLTGAEGFIHESEYQRSDFTPSHSNFKPGLDRASRNDRERSSGSKISFDRYKNHFHDPDEAIHSQDRASSSAEEDSPTETGRSTLFTYIMYAVDMFRANLPSVSPIAQVVATSWTVVAVFMSYGLSFTWSNERRSQCGQWCSPIDVDGSILENTGFALFMILTFRASDAMNRYEEGAILLYDMEMHLRNLAVEIVQSFNEGTCHKQDKERVIAHIIQIPLCFRDLLLKIERELPEQKEGFLSEKDRAAFEKSPDPIEYLLQTVDAYILQMDSLSQNDENNLSDGKSPGSLTYSILDRVSKVRLTIAHALAVKRFPVVSSYTKHQQLFMGLWLALLPLGMAPQTGWFTIIWAPIISYGVFGLEDIATKLVDPFGLDDIDIPVEKICLSSAHKILRAVHGTGWDCKTHVVPSPKVSDISKEGNEDSSSIQPAKFDSFDTDGISDRFGEGELGRQNIPVKKKFSPSLYTHFIRSVPWWTLLYVTIWTSVGVVISFITRRQNGRARWWESRISIDSSVSTYVSFAAFTLLGFYVEASFMRYNDAGIMWTDSLRSSCHALAAQWFSMFEQGTWHKNDNARVIGHIAALPLLVKCELRGGRDLTELKGLLSHEDVGKILDSPVMSSHCLDVIRSYFIAGARHKNRLSKPVYGGHRLSFVQLEIKRTEATIRSAMFLKKYAIAPGFIVLLNMLIATWFFLLPFVLAETSGWFTILWIPLIAYGVLGVYYLAKELQQPFGFDVNDLDLDLMANEIVEDVLFVQKHYRRGIGALVENVEGPTSWWHIRRRTTDSVRSTGEEEEEEIELSKRRRLKRKSKAFKKVAWKFSDAVRLAKHAIGIAAMFGVTGWTAAMVAFTWWLSSRWTSWNEGKVTCDPWWCSPIAVDESVKEYVGFALFLLLGFRLYDSHWRYVEALRIWQEGIIGNTRLLTNRLFESYPAGTWHDGDLERIAGHVSAFAVVTVGGLREISKREQLLQMLGPEDVRRIETADDAGTYCIDVVRAYLIDGDRLRAEDRHPCGSNVHWMLLWYITMLGDTASECERMIRIAVPFGYVQHLRIFMYVYLLMLPLGLVEETGWVTILWVAIIAYGVLGVEHWAEELANPFGFDVSDVPLDELCDEVIEVVRVNLHMYQDGNKQLVRQDRKSFPSADVVQNSCRSEREIERRHSDPPEPIGRVSSSDNEVRMEV